MNKFDFRLVQAVFRQLPNFITIGLLVVGGLFIFRELKAFTSKFSIDIGSLKDERFSEQQRRIDELNRQYLQLSENTARAQTNIVSRNEIEKLFKEAFDASVQEMAKRNHEQIAALGKAIAGLGKNVQFNVKPDGSFEFVTPQGDTARILNNYVYADSQDGERGIRIAQVTFDLSDQTFDNFAEPLQVEATSVRTKQVSGGLNHYVNIIAHNPYDPIYKAKPYRLRLDTVVVAETENKDKKWYFPDPHLEGGFGLGSNFTVSQRSVGFDLGLSMIAYGVSAHDNTLRLVRFGLGISETVDESYGSFSPIGVNARSLGVPFLKDTWWFPGLSFRKNGNIGFATSVSTTF